jgi:hypothetical protein
MDRKILPAVAASLLFATAASATPIFDPSTSRCTDRNCSTVELGGTVPGFLSSGMPWVIQVFATESQCLRLEVTSQEADLEMRVISPDGSKSWVNDDSTLAPCPLCPLVTVNPTRHNGWYTVHIGEFGGGSVQANFTFAYGRYNRNNPNCTTFIPPADAPAQSIDKGSPSPAPDPKSAPGR